MSDDNTPDSETDVVTQVEDDDPESLAGEPVDVNPADPVDEPDDHLSPE